MKKNREKLLLEKIREKCKRDYPFFTEKERKILTYVIFVQRMWRQKKTKALIHGYLLPQFSPSIPQQNSVDFHLDSKATTLTLDQTSELIKKYNNSKS